MTDPTHRVLPRRVLSPDSRPRSHQPRLTMADLATVRAEIKAWERSFKDTNGSMPTLNDIKANNAIGKYLVLFSQIYPHTLSAEKYKLYKRLSKAAASLNSSKNTSTPSTPPRSVPAQPKASTSILRSTSRAIQPSAPLASFNPFSPQKKSKREGKDRVSSTIRDESPPPQATKRRISNEGFSLGLTPFIKPGNTGSSATPLSYSLPLRASPVSAVSRARKRLRGEPVSPSPNKGKRRRVSSQTTLSFPRLNLDIQSEEESDEPPEGDSSFVDNSPMKAKSGKLFPALFEHDAPMDLFGINSDLQMVQGDSKNSVNANRKHATPAMRPKPAARASSKSVKPARVVPSSGNSDPPGQRLITTLPTQSQSSTVKDNQSEVSDVRSSVKRALNEETDNETVSNSKAKSPLLPPSPPPPTSGQQTSNKGGKSKSYSKGNPKGRKKSRLSTDLQDDGESDGQEFMPKLRMVKRHDSRSHYSNLRPLEDGAASDSDPNLGHTRFPMPHAASPDNSQLKDGDVEIDLPEQLRSVLAIDAVPNNRGSDEKLVKGLLYGRRVTHYDPNKGGEIWDIGEDDHESNDGHSRYTEGEDEWEGEPVPWEVAEL